MTTPLPLPDDPRIADHIERWPQYRASFAYPRSVWLSQLEVLLREHYPDASSKRLTLTARLAAPFPLARPGVP